MTEKPSLALLPGLLCTADLWQHQIAHLGPRADCWVADFTTQDTIGDMAESVLAAMPPRFYLAALSMGGYVALEIMVRAPQRVIKLALLDSRCGLDSPEEAARRRGLIELAKKGRFLGVAPQLLPLFIHPDRVDDPAVAGVMTKMAADLGKDAFIRQQTAIAGREDSTLVLPQIPCETLLICGRQDWVTPLAGHEEMAAAIPRAQLHVIEDCGHLSALERPAAVNCLLDDWLFS